MFSVRLHKRLVVLLLLSLCSCATSLVKKDISRQSDGWTVVFHELLDGPNGFTTRDGTKHLPKSGLRFVWVILSIQNDQTSARQFTFDSCGIDMDDSASLPLYVGMNLGTSAEASGTPELAAGERITRKLAFGYPEGKRPQRLVCFGNAMEL